MPSLTIALSSSAIEIIDCAIVGGGPSGLAAAIALGRGANCSKLAVFEKDNFQPKGASIQISKTGWKSIQKLDEALVPLLEETGVAVTAVELKPWGAKNPMKKKQQGFLSKAKQIPRKLKEAIMGRFVNAMVNRVHLWHDVRMVLCHHAVSRTNDSLLFPNCDLCEIIPLDLKEGPRFELVFQRENELFRVRSNFVLACDGTKSRVRALLPNEQETLLAENKSVWRGMAPNYDCKGKATFYRGLANSETNGRSALIFPGGKDSGSSWTVISDIADGKSQSTEEARTRVLTVLKSMGTKNNGEYERLKQIVQDSNVVIENKLHVRDFDQKWESSYDGLAFMGDAAHPVRPTGEGTALAFEDANVLQEIVAELGLSVKALRMYEEKRYLPIKTISQKIRDGANEFYKEDGRIVGNIEND